MPDTLFQVGPLAIERRPFNIGEWSRKVSADWAKKDLLGAPLGREFVGEGEGSLKLKGKVHPYHYGGLSEIEIAQGMVRSGDAQFVTRGDGAVFGWYAVTSFEESHSFLGPGAGGVGGVVEHEMELVPVGDPGSGAASALVSALVSLFG